ncbi:MAG: gluconate 2-dehydrogenase subunit 3 family protein [Proteobacteria bacterium]|nr:gluconate 2-dehydrogenase subunit 3 family protein [Pseudomonadota bacterium]
MNRRDALRYFALASGGVFGVRLAQAAAHVHSAAQAAAPDTVGSSAAGVSDAAVAQPSLLDERQRTMLSDIAELIIPATDTPGAVEAGVPAFIDHIVSTWFTTAERVSFLKGLDELDAFCSQRFSRSFALCDAGQRSAALTEAERRATGYQPEPMKTVADAVGGEVPFFPRVKALTVLGYYTSEVGATQELSYNPIPASYDGDYDFARTGRQWSS